FDHVNTSGREIADYGSGLFGGCELAGSRGDGRLVAAKQRSSGMAARSRQDRTGSKNAWTFSATLFNRTREVDDPRICGTDITDRGDSVAQEFTENSIDDRVGLWAVEAPSNQGEGDVNMTVDQTRQDGQSGEILALGSLRDHHLGSPSNSRDTTVFQDDDRVR